MNLLRFLRSTKGAIKPLNALLISGAAGVGFFFVVNTAANKQIEAERRVRTLGEISQAAPQEGMHHRDGMLTSINVRDSRNQLATAEERAAMQGNSALDRYNANRRALGNMESSIGRAAEFADSDEGLNTANRDAQPGSTRFSVGNPNAVNVPRNVPGAYDDDDGYDRRSPTGRGRGSEFASASMARASGNSFSGSYTPGASGGIADANTGSEGPRRLSGAMPGGSNIVSRMESESGLGQRNNTSSFGRERDGRGTGGSRTGNGKGELEDILKKSAAAAANLNASANEGGRAFLANARNSGGISVDGETTSGSATSSDLTAPTAKKLKAIGNRLKQEETKQEERLHDQNNLLHWFWGVLAGSIAGIVAISLLHKAGAMWWVKLIQWALVAAIAGLNATLFVKAAKFYNNWGASGGTAIVNLCKVMAPLLTGAAVYSAIVPNAWSKIWTTMKTKFKEMFGLAGITSTAMGAIGNATKGAISEAMDNSKKS